MRILFSLTYFSPYSSGLTLYVKRLAGELAGKNRVTVLCLAHEKNLKTEEIVNGIKVVRAKPLFKISKGFFSVDWFFKSFRLSREADITVISLPQFEGFIPALASKIYGKKVISIYHCEVVLPAGFLNRIAEKMLTAANMLSLSLSDKVITYTEDFARNSKVLPKYYPKIKYVYPPMVLPKTDKRVQNLIRDKIGCGNDFVIGVAARLAAEKGIEYLFEAIPLLSSKSGLKTDKFKIIIAGSLNPVGEESYKKKILKLVEKYKEQIVFLGELKEEEMGSFYSLIDVLVLPSVNSTEAFGMVQVEAMMTGVPVVASDLPGVRIPIQKTGMGMIVPVKNSGKLAEAISEVLLNRKQYIKDQKKATQEFDQRKTFNFYQKLLGN